MMPSRSSSSAGILAVAVVLMLGASARGQDSEEGETIVDWYFYDVGNPPEGKLTSVPLAGHRRTTRHHGFPPIFPLQWQEFPFVTEEKHDYLAYQHASRPGDECYYNSMGLRGVCTALEHCPWAQQEMRASGRTQVCDAELVCCPAGHPYELAPQPPCNCGPHGQGEKPSGMYSGPHHHEPCHHAQGMMPGMSHHGSASPPGYGPYPGFPHGFPHESPTASGQYFPSQPGNHFPGQAPTGKPMYAGSGGSYQGKPTGSSPMKDKDMPSYLGPKPAGTHPGFNAGSAMESEMEEVPAIDLREPPLPGKSPAVYPPGAIARKMCVEYERYGPRLRFGPDKDCIPNHTYPIGGNPALPTEFPHFAQLGVGRRDSIQYYCGGSLIAPTWVLTAAHCVFREDMPVQWVRFGDQVPDSDTDDSFPQIIEVVQRVMHPDYSARTVYNDVALLQIRNAPNMTTPHVRPACLQIDKQLQKDKLNLIGFGLTEENGTPAKELMEVALWRTPYEKCAKFFQGAVNLRQLPRGLDDDTQLCAGLDQVGKDACQGDSGGPLNTPYSPTCMHNVAGITSFGQGCGRGKPGVYTRVSHFVPWIERIVWADQML